MPTLSGARPDERMLPGPCHSQRDSHEGCTETDKMVEETLDADEQKRMQPENISIRYQGARL